MRNFKWAMLFMSVVLGGCTSLETALPSSHSSLNQDDAKQGNAALASATLCCQRYADIPYQPLGEGKEINLTIDHTSPVYSFPEGKSYFAAYRLPENRGSFTLDVSSFFTKTVFIPQLILLDGNFNITRTIKSDDFKYFEPKLIRAEQYASSLTVDRSHEGNINNELYLLIYTPAEQLLKSSIVDSDEMRYAKSLALAEPRNGKVAVPHSAWGSLQLEIHYLQAQSDEAPVFIPAAETPAATASAVSTTASTAVVASTPATTNVDKILPQTERYYNQQIIDAVNKKDMARAVSLYKEAMKLGSASAEATFLDALKK